MILEMIEVREIDTVRAMLRTQVFARVKQEEPDRYLRLDHLSGRTYFDIRCGLSCIVQQLAAWAATTLPVLQKLQKLRL